MISVFVDEGSSFVKAMEIGNHDSYITFPSRVKSGKIQDMSNPETFTSDRSYQMPNGDYLSVCPTTDNPQNTSTSAEYQTSDTNLVLVHDALRIMGYGGQDVDLTVTLPIGLFFAKDGFNKELVQAKKDRLMSAITHCNGKPLANIAAVTVRPEGYSIAMDAMLDDGGELKDDYAHVSKIFVADIGGTSTDMALMSMDGQIENTKSSLNAVFPMRARLETLITDAFPLQNVPVSVMDKVLVDRKLGDKDVSQLVDQAAREQASSIIKDMSSFAGDMSSINILVIGGGGAYTIGQHIKAHFPTLHVVIPDSPEKSVLRGYDKLAVSMA